MTCEVMGTRRVRVYSPDMDMRTAEPSPIHDARAPFGNRLRAWRQQRRFSQLDLAHEANISTRHLSFVETGRAMPSREMVLRLADRLDVPLRERNALLVAAGYAPMFRERALDDPELESVLDAVKRVLKGHEPFPALAVDRWWNLVAANDAVAPLLAGADVSLLTPPINVLRLALHPRGIASRIGNFAQWREHLLDRLHRQAAATADPALQTLFEELRALPSPEASSNDRFEQSRSDLFVPAVFVPLRLRTEHGVLSFISTTTVFGTPMDVTLQELAIESFFPADGFTQQAIHQSMLASQ